MQTTHKRTIIMLDETESDSDVSQDILAPRKRRIVGTKTVMHRLGSDVERSPVSGRLVYRWTKDFLGSSYLGGEWSGPDRPILFPDLRSYQVRNLRTTFHVYDVVEERVRRFQSMGCRDCVDVYVQLVESCLEPVMNILMLYMAYGYWSGESKEGPSRQNYCTCDRKDCSRSTAYGEMVGVGFDIEHTRMQWEGRHHFRDRHMARLLK